MKTVRVFECFSGIGAQAMALKALERDFPDKVHFEFVGTSEIEKYAIILYKAVHGDVPNFGDISKIDWNDVPDFDLATWSFPCTDISQAGQQKGLSKDSSTRSSLAWEALRCFKAKRPKYLLMENVGALVSKKFMPDFIQLQKELEDIGYTNYWAKLNAVDFDCPQNRLRVFMVSFIEPRGFEWPKPIPLTKCIADFLEDEVDERYFLKSDRVDEILRQMRENNVQLPEPVKLSSSQNSMITPPQDICPCHCVGAHGGVEPKTFVKCQPTINE